MVFIPIANVAAANFCDLMASGKTKTNSHGTPNAMSGRARRKDGVSRCDWNWASAGSPKSKGVNVYGAADMTKGNRDKDHDRPIMRYIMVTSMSQQSKGGSFSET